MNVELLYSIFRENLTDELALQLDSSFKDKFISEINEKESRLYLKGEALATDMAQYCNLCEKLAFPVYFQDNVPKLKLDIGLNHFTDEMLEECNKILDHHIFTKVRFTRFSFINF